jgi:DNA-binding CsgD family transcriptional regulator
MQTESRCPVWLVLMLLALGLVGIIDLVLDSARQVSTLHLLVEFAFVSLALAAAVVLGRRWYCAEHRLSIVRVKEERAQTYIDGLSKAIDRQFCEWGLSEAERSTALLMLKGLSHKDIAAATGRSARTVRQHAVAVYRKSGLSGRAELAAFFLEDLLLPDDAERQQDRPANHRAEPAPAALQGATGDASASRARHTRRMNAGTTLLPDGPSRTAP